jgi:hypothetical protein
MNDGGGNSVHAGEVGLTVLREEAKAGFPRLIGTFLAGTLPLSQVLINDVLRRLPQAPPGLALDVLPANRVVARYGFVRATVVLEEHVRVGDGPPQITVRLASAVVAWTLGWLLRVPAVRMAGRRVTIDLGALDGMAAYRPYWSLLRRVELRTTPGQVHVDFELAVT